MQGAGKAKASPRLIGMIRSSFSLGELIPRRFLNPGLATDRREGYKIGGYLYTRRNPMIIVQVHVHVKPEYVAAFQSATIENARRSLLESGIARFDVLQQTSDPCRFTLVEVYRDPEAPARHKSTEHYTGWRDTVAPMMAEPRASVVFRNTFPEDSGW
jgi:autoinducer 2-degrading protein